MLFTINALMPSIPFQEQLKDNIKMICKILMCTQNEFSFLVKVDGNSIKNQNFRVSVITYNFVI